MTSETLHTCSYSCERFACVLAQRNELRARVEDSQAAANKFANLQQADEALMRQALEALETVWPIIEGEKFKQECSYGGNFNESKTDRARKACVDSLAAIAALRAALAEQEDDLTAAWMAGAAEARKRAEQAQPVAWAEQIVEHLTALHNTEMIRELDSGDALIRLDDAIAAVDEARDRYTTPPAPQPLTIERLRDALVASRIIDPGAVEDPDNYDDGVTLHRIEALHRRIT